MHACSRILRVLKTKSITCLDWPFIHFCSAREISSSHLPDLISFWQYPRLLLFFVAELSAKMSSFLFEEVKHPFTMQVFDSFISIGTVIRKFILFFECFIDINVWALIFFLTIFFNFCYSISQLLIFSSYYFNSNFYLIAMFERILFVLIPLVFLTNHTLYHLST